MRLSWPRDNDKRRAITGDLPSVATHAIPETSHFFINTTWGDVELHGRLSPQMEPVPEAESSPDLWMQHQLRASHMDLLHYCKLETAPCY